MSIKCDNLDELTKFQYNSNSSTPALSQGLKFKKYQNKYNKNSDNYIVEGFVEGNTVQVISTDDPTFTNNPSENPLTTQTGEVIADNQQTIDEQSQLYEQLKKANDEYLKQYQNLMAKINKKTEDYIKRTSSNTYLGKTIRFTNGNVCYVTNQGVVKYIPSQDVWNSLVGNNCGVTKTYTDVNIKYPDDNTPGTLIPELNLILGPPMQMGQSCGNAGKNVFVNKLMDNPQEKYIGCYNDKPPSTDILFVPIMNSSNSVNGFKSYSSSVYQNNNRVWGSWAAFNRKDDPYWHSQVSTNNNYNGTTGEYTGKTKIENIKTKNGVQTIKGENLQINLPQNYTLTKYELKGRQNCCGNPNARSPNSWMVIGWDGYSWNEVDRKENQGLSYEKRTYYITNPKPYNAYLIIITNCGNPGDRTGNRYCVQIAQWNLFTSSDVGFMDSKRAMKFQPDLVNRVDFDTCKKFAAENGYKYFGLQDVQSDGNAQCLVSNDLATTQQYGKGNDFKPFVLWHANTGNGRGATTLLNNQASLVVNNSSNSAVWASPGGQPSNYLGCYGDSRNRAMPLLNNGNQSFNYQKCLDQANKGKYKYFGLQNSTSGQNAQCGLSNDFITTTKYGKANNCTKISDGTFSGGGWSNAVYSTDVTINSFLILQDDGNMVIYRGTSPSDNQGYIWGTQTNGKQKEKNPNFSAEKSKFGKNWISNGTTLAIGDFIGSNDGSIYLLMQTDGNLILFTSEKSDGCLKTNSSGKKMGGSWMNAVYEFAKSGFKENIGKLGFVDENDVLYNYPLENIQFTNTYTKFDKYDAYGADLPSASYGGATIERCQTTCNNNQKCYGFAFDNQNKVCYPKSSEMWPYGGPSRPLSNVDTYVRNKIPKSVPLGAKSDTNNIDSYQYQFYNKGSPVPQKYGLILATQTEKDELKQLEVKMKAQSEKVTNLLNKFNKSTYTSQSQAEKNLQGLREYQTEMQNTIDEIDILNSKSETNIESFTNYGYSADNNLNKILQDSDISVLQKNYEYLLWSILASGSVLVAMNITKS